MCNRSFLSSSYRRSSAVSSLKLSEVSRSFSTTSNNKKAPVVNLYNELRDWRKRTSDELQTPVYRVMNNNLLESISTRKPVTMRELSTLSGIGHSKLIQYGSKILDIVRKHVEYDDLTASETDYELSDQLFWNDYSKFDAKKKKPKTKAADKAGSDSKVTTRKRIGMVSPEALQDIHLPDMLPTDLNDEQLAAANHILEGHNTFLTGSAGTGKTHVLKYVIQEFTNKYGEEAVAVTAPTGISALNIGGKTIHGFAGIGLG